MIAAADSPLAVLARKWRICHGATVINRWKFCQAVAQFVKDHGRQFTHDEIAAACGRAVRDKPYGRGFVCRNLEAARAFPKEPANDDERLRFAGVLHGKEPAKQTKSQANLHPEKLIAIGIGSLRRAIKQGASVEDVISKVESELRGKARVAA